ncbi:MAG: transcriptional regulator TrmB [Candidatus Peregrinibacteria bacterium GW2011_GWF2_33_10]|nr:MAG: transcriptional regulator TrmB [Candidatus Peregrinibacteria bacterium GW2011_GWF2_33_10]OGJ44684.1 MAG: hypothetical protein A2263_01060 [Candidatus Peregrinibacteria bacterium RIFOXYA2_FULL_33_21]OGJ45648.1 MAG: hypothetical protein A2272_06525 [Candidatus Peregrinibacteria bacterium RIFOXYA12_FULL_33_12]OGJ50418.1 MAG: hypothetical protein A2307_06120 [Candidatus Peregrinibacteria bacterium RIFOXYB2_FULL_33_20]
MIVNNSLIPWPLFSLGRETRGNNMLTKFLKSIGLSEKEAQIYLSMLEIGSNGVSVIAKKSNLTRTTAYSVLETLQKKGFVTFYEKNKIKYYSAEQPEIIKYILNQKENECRKQEKEFQNLLPEFESLINKNQILPKVKFFEGLDGIIEIYEDTLKNNKSKLAYSSIPNVQNEKLKKYIQEDYLSKRKKLKINVRAIFQDTPESREFIKNDKFLLRESRLVPVSQFQFRSEINIYKNKIAMMSLDANSMHGVIIESEPIAETQKAIFEVAWMNVNSNLLY